MEHHDDDHERRAPVVDAAQYPTQRLSVVQLFQAMVSFSSRWDIRHRQENSGRNLDRETGKRHAAERVEPTPRARRNGVPGSLSPKLGQMQALLKPKRNIS